MENVFVAIIVIFLLLFGSLTMSNAYISAEQTMLNAQQGTDTRVNEIARTALSAEAIRILNSGTLIEVRLRNSGSVKLADFNQWDVFSEYYDSAVTPVYHIERLPYEASATVVNAWSVSGIYLDWLHNIGDQFDPGILNPGEEIVMHLTASPAVGIGQSVSVTVATDNGVAESITGKRNAPPVLALNTGLKVAAHGSQPLTVQMLLTQDADDDPSQLTYTVVTPPTQGTVTVGTPPTQGALTPAMQFTQQQINDSEVVYTHTSSSSDPDSFAVTLTDGIDIIGPFTFPITINAPPVLAGNAGLTLPAGTMATITNGLLQVTDSDDPSDHLTYTVTQFPANGTLSLGSTFTQADIDNNRLTYTHMGTDADLFKFIVSDGYDVIGTYTFVITLVS